MTVEKFDPTTDSKYINKSFEAIKPKDCKEKMDMELEAETDENITTTSAVKTEPALNNGSSDDKKASSEINEAVNNKVANNEALNKELINNDFTAEHKTLIKNGLWSNNAALVQLLGLCPLLAVSSTVTNALGLGIATLFVLMMTNLFVSLARQYIPDEIRIPIFVMIIAGVVTCVQLLISAYAYGLYLSLGIFIPLIVTNCVIIGRAEAYASKNSPLKSVLDGFWMGLGMLAVLVLLGALREVIGQGTLFDGADLLLGNWASSLRIEVFQIDNPFLLAILPPGAFIGVGFLIALKQAIDKQIMLRSKPKQKKVIERVRVTNVQ